MTSREIRIEAYSEIAHALDVHADDVADGGVVLDVTQEEAERIASIIHTVADKYRRMAQTMHGE